MELSKNEQLDEYLKCLDDPLYFIKNYCYIKHPSMGSVKFGNIIFSKQEEFINIVANNRFTISNKTRQCGFSTILGMFSLQQALFTENYEILIISRKDEEAKRFKKRNIDFVYERLPTFLKMESKQNKKKFADSTHSKEFANGSVIRSEAGPNAGRGSTSNLIILDEAGFIEHAEDLWSAVFPSLNVGKGKAVINSTSSAMGTWYSDVWQAALREENSFNPISIDWFDVPHFKNTEGWLEEQEKNLTPHSKFRREVLREFIIEGETYIPDKFIKALTPTSPFRSDFIFQESIIDVNEILKLPESGFDDTKNYVKGLWIWKEPVKGHSYICGVDVSSGSGKDRSTIQVIDMETSDQVAEYMGKIDTNQLSIIAYKLGKYYNTAMIAVEYNNMGSTVFNELDYHMEYPNLYWRPKGLPGWFTSTSSRDFILNALYKTITHGLVKINSSRLKQEIQNLVTINGKTQAAQGTNDDLVMAFSIAVYLIEEYAMTPMLFDIQDDTRILEDTDIEEQTTEIIKKRIEENTDLEINLNESNMYKWMY
jgi:hypothetical protein